MALIIQMLNALSFAAILFLLASGLCLMLSLMNVVNLAHGSLYMLAGYIGYSVGQWADSFLMALVTGISTTALISFLMDRIFFRYFKDHLEQILLTFGFIYIFQDVARTLWHGNYHFVSAPAILSGSIHILGAVFPMFRLCVIGIGVFVALGLWLLQEKTKIGALIRAGVDDSLMVQALGVDINRIFTLVFTMAGALAGLSGVLGSVLIGAYIGADLDILIFAVVVIVIGGLGTLQGAMVGSVLIGFAEVFGRAFLPEFAHFFVYGVMAVILATRPSGLLGRTS